MSFWGEFVQPGQPYTLKLEGDHKRLRISQATLGERDGGIFWRSRSILYCVVGSKPQVAICSLSNERSCCMLDLEFEESEDVVFTVVGPRGIHISGYYVMPRVPTDTSRADDLKINCSGEEEISKAENDYGSKLTEEEEGVGKTRDNSNSSDGHNDVCIDTPNFLMNTVVQELNTTADDEGMENIKQQGIKCSFGGFLGGMGDHVVCARDSSVSATEVIVEDEWNADRVTSQPTNTLGKYDSNCKGKEKISKGENDKDKKLTEEDKSVGKTGDDSNSNDADVGMENSIKQQAINCSINSLLDGTDDCVSCARESNISATEVIIEDECKADHMTRQANNALGKHESEQQSKGIPKGCSNLRTHDPEVGIFKNIDIEHGKGLQTRPGSNDMSHEGARNQQTEESTVNMFSHGVCEEAARPNNLIQSFDVRSEHSDWKTKKRKKSKHSKRESPGEDSASFDNVQENIDQKAINGSMAHNLPEQKSAYDKFSDGAREEAACTNHLVQSFDVRSKDSDQNTKKRKKTKISKRKPLDENGCCFDNVQDQSTNGSTAQNLPEQAPTFDKGNDLYAHKKKKKKKKEVEIKDDNSVKNLYAKSSQISTSSNDDLIIEVLTAGEHDGEAATMGKKVKVFYTARLKGSTSIIASNVSGRPFKFCIGDEKIIEGWNVCVDGMCVGEKRRVTIPPLLGYGKRFQKVIPPNSWLEYDIELVSVC